MNGLTLWLSLMFIAICGWALRWDVGRFLVRTRERQQMARELLDSERPPLLCDSRDLPPDEPHIVFRRQGLL